MLVEDTPIEGVKIVTPKKFGDERGFFSETYNRSKWEAAGLRYEFVQDNHSLSAAVGVLRGLHFQKPPFGQDKLVRVLRGRVLDVVVDLRRSSPTFKKHVAVSSRLEIGSSFLRRSASPMGSARSSRTRRCSTRSRASIPRSMIAASPSTIPNWASTGRSRIPRFQPMIAIGAGRSFASFLSSLSKRPCASL